MFIAPIQSHWKHKAPPSAIEYRLRTSAIGDRHRRTRPLVTTDDLRQMEKLRGCVETCCAENAMRSPKEHKLRTHRTPAFRLQIECTKRRSESSSLQTRVTQSSFFTLSISAASTSSPIRAVARPLSQFARNIHRRLPDIPHHSKEAALNEDQLIRYDKRMTVRYPSPDLSKIASSRAIQRQL
jgi:hypothetical protein